jgi:2-octaprenylphenol hydroxylase
MTPDFDIIIAGGGLVGMTLACALAEHGLSVALVENRPPPAAPLAVPETSDNRVFALTRASERILRHLGAWEKFPPEAVSAFGEMHVWENRGEIHFDCADLAEPCLGFIVEHRVLQRGLAECCAQWPGIHWLRPRRLEHFTRHEAAVEVRLDNGERFSARLLVGADGGNSQVRKLAGIACDKTAYGHHALVATVKTALPHRATAWQRFTPDGPLAFLPLADPYTSSIVWSSVPARCEQLMWLEEDEFRLELAQAFAHKLGDVTWSGPRLSYPLYRRHARQYVQPRLALIGDAAHTIHPLAGQGVNLGLLDAASLAEVLLAARRAEIGDYPVLRRYERWRKGDNLTMLRLMDGFKHLFGSHPPPLSWARNLGLTLAHRSGPLKNLLARQAMGRAGDVPGLARGYVPNQQFLTHRCTQIYSDSLQPEPFALTLHPSPGGRGTLLPSSFGRGAGGEGRKSS